MAIVRGVIAEQNGKAPNDIKLKVTSSTAPAATDAFAEIENILN